MTLKSLERALVSLPRSLWVVLLLSLLSPLVWEPSPVGFWFLLRLLWSSDVLGPADGYFGLFWAAPRNRVALNVLFPPIVVVVLFAQHQRKVRTSTKMKTSSKEATAPTTTTTTKGSNDNPNPTTERARAATTKNKEVNGNHHIQQQRGNISWNMIEGFFKFQNMIILSNHML